MGVLALGLGLGAAARSLPAERAWNLLAGLCLIAALVVGLTLLPWWTDRRAALAPLPYLFKAPRPSERWCTRCGSATPKKGPCRLCGHVVVPARQARQTPGPRGK
jgi:hypothetical protein